jgi:nicotinate-nucleotide pyrophosphorylase (carboxylating)
LLSKIPTLAAKIIIVRIDGTVIYSLVNEFLHEDIGRGDITTQAVVADTARGRGRFWAKQDLVIAGLEVAEAVFITLDPELQLEAFVYEGETVKAGTEIARLDGPASVLLAGERVALNLLQRMSGIGQANTRIVDTRKTAPGLRRLDKYAVTVGGGYNHRFGLDDGILIKDNHIMLAGSVEKAIRRARAHAGHLNKIEVEVASLEQLNEALQAQADVILLDNMTPEQTAAAVAVVREAEKNGQRILLEASGGITLDNVAAYAQAGVDMISIGALTHSVKAVDISFKISLIG